jgi:hypothetical protein
LCLGLPMASSLCLGLPMSSSLRFGLDNAAIFALWVCQCSRLCI